MSPGSVSVELRPRPRPKLSAGPRPSSPIRLGQVDSPSRSYAQVLVTPSPPRRRPARPHWSVSPDLPNASPAASIMELSSSSDVSLLPVAKAIKPVFRVPASKSMSTRSSNGIVKKRVLEDAAVFSDRESLLPVTPSKKQRLSKHHGLTDGTRVEASASSYQRKPTLSNSRSFSQEQSSSGVVAVVSSSDDTPSRYIATELRKRQPSKRSASKRPLKRLPDEPSVSPIKPMSVKIEFSEDEMVTAAPLLPSVVIRSSPGESIPHFTAEKHSRHHSSLKGPKKSSSRNHKAREPSTSPAPWPVSPSPVRSSDTKGKARASQIEDHADEQDTIKRDAADLKASKMKKSGSSSKTTTATRPAKNSFQAALEKKGITLQKALENSSPGTRSKEQYLADFNGYRVPSLPVTCEVTTPDTQDVLLADDYPGLPNLTAGSFRSWSSAHGDGFVRFSAWATQLPALNFDDALAAVRFTQHKHFVNLSRVSPMNLSSVFTSHDNTKSLLHADTRMAVCLSAMLVVESHLLTPTDRGLFNKYIRGTLHGQEMERLVGATCMSFGHTVLHAQIERDNMIFATGGNWNREGRAAASSASQYIRSPGLLAKSPTKSHGRFRQLLDVTDTVPIYDARKHLFDYATDLENIDSVLPMFNEEIPAGSFAVVAYTMSIYKKAANFHLSTNVQFVILVKDFE